MDQDPTARSVSIPRVLVGLAIDYFRWTQLVPMITAWAFLLLMVGAMLLVNFQRESFSLIEWSVVSYERMFGPIEQDRPPVPDTLPAAASERTVDGAIEFSDEDFMPWVLSAWGVLALAGWLLGLLRAAVLGPSKPMRLKRKLILAAAPAAACTVLFFAAYLFGSEAFHGSAAGWTFLFIGFPLGVWIVSAYSLAVAHGLDVVRQGVVEPADI